MTGELLGLTLCDVLKEMGHDCVLVYFSSGFVFRAAAFLDLRTKCLEELAKTNKHIQLKFFLMAFKREA